MAAGDLDELCADLDRLLPLGGERDAPTLSVDGARGGAWTVVRTRRRGVPTRRVVLTRADILRLMARLGVRGVYACMPSAEVIELVADVERGEAPLDHRRPLHPVHAITRANYTARVRTDAERAEAMRECLSPAQCDLIFDICDLAQQCTAQLFGGTPARSAQVTIKRKDHQTAVYISATLTPPVVISHVLFEQLRGVAPESIDSIVASLEGIGWHVDARITLLVGPVTATTAKRRRDDDDDLPTAKRRA